MQEADFVYEQLGNPVDGYQVHRLAAWDSYYVLPIGEDPDKEVDPNTATPSPLEFTLSKPDEDTPPPSVQIDWNISADLPAFVNVVEKYYRATDDNLGWADYSVNLIVSRPEDEHPNHTIDKDYPRPMDSHLLAGVLEEANIAQSDVSSVTVSNSAGGFMWMPDNRAAADIFPGTLKDPQLGIQAMVEVFDATRDPDTTPTVAAFQQGLTYAVTDLVNGVETTTPQATL